MPITESDREKLENFRQLIASLKNPDNGLEGMHSFFIRIIDEQADEIKRLNEYLEEMRDLYYKKSQERGSQKICE